MRQSENIGPIGWFFLGRRGVEGVLRKAFIEKGALELGLPGRVGVYHVESR